MSRDRSHYALAWVEQVIESGTNLTKWEHDFADSIHEKIIGGCALSERELDILEGIYTEKTS